MNALGIICGAIGGWIVAACLLAPTLGRAMKHADPGEDDEQYEPPTSVPQPDSTWMDLVSVDCLRDSDPLLHERFEAIVEGDWFDGALHYTGHGHDGDAA